MTKQATKKEKKTATRITTGKRGRPAAPLAKRITQGERAAMPPEVKTEPKATASVVGQHWKTKAGKAGVWKADKLNDAVRNAFLSEGGSDVDAQKAARIATDKILAENHLDAGRWNGKNAGMLSMNLRNVLRGLIRNDGLCMVYGKKIA